jgi:peptidoglycan/LPS O-acetylase OafA/YrhL
MKNSTVAAQPEILNTKRDSRYRPEIDGLRAFAVVAVIVNHFDKHLLPSGYLGVDIFFVISGYVITSSLSGRQSKSFAEFLSSFYKRRLKRLAPALLVFVLVTSFLICLFNPEPSLALKTGASSLFGLSNFYLLRQSTDYFAQSTELNPFTHTWSLGVEEQFYIFFPVLAWFSGFGRQKPCGARNLFMWIAVLSGISLGAFIYLYHINQPAAYFLMPTRFWEMAAGCLVYIGFQKRVKLEQMLGRISPFLVIVAMLAVMLLPVDAAIPATILMVLLTTVLLACLKSGTAVFAAFTNKTIVYLGLISYSLYLWHWGVLSIARWTIGVSVWTTPFLLVIIFSLSSISYRFVESPIRLNQINLNEKTLNISIYLSLISAFLLTIGLSFYGFRLFSGSNKGVSARFASGSNEMKSYVGPVTKRKSEECGLLPTEINDVIFKQKIAQCLWVQSTGYDAKNTVVYLGNSHAQQLFPISEEVARLGENSVFNIHVGHCALPHLEGIKHKNGSSCELMDKLPVLANKHLKKPLIFVVASHLSPDYVPPEAKWSDEGYARKFEKLIQSIGEKNFLIYVAPNPKFLGLGDGLCVPDWFRPYPSCSTSVNEGEQRSIRRAYIHYLQQLSQKYSNFAIVDPFELLCGEIDGKCFADRGDFNVYWDPSHLTVRGVLLTWGLHRQAIDKANKYINGSRF